MAMHLNENLDDNGEMHDINVTPFIDVMLVLLIIFMVDKAFTTHPALGAQCLMRYAYQAYKIYCNMLNLHAFVGG